MILMHMAWVAALYRRDDQGFYSGHTGGVDLSPDPLYAKDKKGRSS